MKVKFTLIDHRTRRDHVRNLQLSQNFRDILLSGTVRANERLSILNVGQPPQEDTSEPLPQFSRNPKLAARRYAIAKERATAAAVEAQTAAENK